jgi:hypothetical protein
VYVPALRFGTVIEQLNVPPALVAHGLGEVVWVVPLKVIVIV